MTIEFIEEGSLSYESYNFACHTLGEASKQCATINQSLKIDKENVGKNNLGDTPLLDPRPSKTKGAPSQRIKSGIEKGRKLILRHDGWDFDRHRISFYIMFCWFLAGHVSMNGVFNRCYVWCVNAVVLRLVDDAVSGRPVGCGSSVFWCGGIDFSTLLLA
ncbi:hypothetical protein QL285_062065 [Trifolium repens]|nr:hypothetical protein QL285_062065 [Trifolium repens]